MTSFKEMLEKKKVNSYPDNSGVRRDTDYISIQALGQWALEECIKDYENTFQNLTKVKWEEWQVTDFKHEKEREPTFSDIVHYELMYDFEYNLALFDIAVACLGESEVKKRLEEIK